MRELFVVPKGERKTVVGDNGHGHATHGSGRRQRKVEEAENHLSPPFAGYSEDAGPNYQERKLLY